MFAGREVGERAAGIGCVGGCVWGWGVVWAVYWSCFLCLGRALRTITVDISNLDRYLSVFTCFL